MRRRFFLRYISKKIYTQYAVFACQRGLKSSNIKMFPNGRSLTLYNGDIIILCTGGFGITDANHTEQNTITPYASCNEKSAYTTRADGSCFHYTVGARKLTLSRYSSRGCELAFITPYARGNGKFG
jgi:hypothetical protein